MTEQRDIVVVGGGIVGTATAYALARQGCDVLLLERGWVGREASGRNAGTLNLLNDRAAGFDDTPVKLAAFARWKTLSDELDFDLEVDLSKGTLLLAETPAELPRLAELQNRYEGKGFPVRWLEGRDLHRFAPYLAAGVPAGIFCALGGMANPRPAAWAFARAARRHGAEVREQTAVIGLTRSAGQYEVALADGAVQARRVVIAAGPWSVALAAALGAEIPLNIRYFQASATSAAPKFLLHGLRRVAGRLTLKQGPQGNCILGGGWVGESAFPQHGRVVMDVIAANFAVAVKLVPALAELSLLRSWAGYDGSTRDELPIIDEIPGWPGVFISTGSSHGFALGPVLGDLTAAMLLRQPPPFDLSPYALRRFERALATS